MSTRNQIGSTHRAFVLIGAAAAALFLVVSAAPGDDKDKKKSAASPKAERIYVRWGQRGNETDEKYDTRYKRLLNRVKKDDPDDRNGGPTPLWTVHTPPFIVRSDVSAEFTADSAMYMEKLHREYGEAYSKLLGGVASKIKEPIEVVVFKDQATYMQNGGSPGSGGQFMTMFNAAMQTGDRGPHWKAQHYRLMQFTNGVSEFAKWEKGTLKHEAAHMEMRMRLGVVVDFRAGWWPVDDPRWFEEGHASVFEFWDFDKSVEENLKEIPDRGRYAPIVRRSHGTDKWKDFRYVWTIDPASWHRDMTTPQGYLNYCQAWSLAAYLMSSDKGRADFRKIYRLSLRVGADRKLNSLGTKTASWQEAFPSKDQAELEKNWNAWIAENLSRDKRVPGEDKHCLRQGYDPKAVATLESIPAEEFKKIREDILKEEKSATTKSGHIEK